MAITVDWSTKVIFVPKADLTLISGSVYELDVDWLRLQLKAIESSENGQVFLDTHQHNTSVVLSGVTYARVITFLDPYTIEFEDGNYTVSCIGANHNLADVKVVNSVSLIINNSAGLIDLNKEDIETAAYNGHIYWDSVNGVDGVGHPYGSERQPVKTQAVAITRALDRNLKSIRMVATAMTVDNSVSMDLYELLGTNRAQTVITFSSADTGDMSVYDARINGSMSGGLYAERCEVESVTGIGCTTNETNFISCALSGEITLRADNNRDLHLIDCTGSSTAILNVNGTQGDLDIEHFSGKLQLKNITHQAAPISASFASMGGILELDATCTYGTVIVCGAVKIVGKELVGPNFNIIDETGSALTTAYLERSVWVDTEAAVNGDGSQGSPFNNLTDTIDFAELENIKTIFVYADIVLDRQLKNFKIIGVGTPTVDTNGQILTKSEFWHCKMEGTYTGNIIVQESVLLDGFELNGFFEKNGLAGDLVCIDGANVFMKDNASAIAGLGRPTISMNAAGWCKLSVRGNEGGLTIKDCNNALDEVTVEVAEGSLTFDASNTTTAPNTMIARGMCKFVNQVPNADVVVDETGFPANINIQHKILMNKTETDPVTGVMTVYEEDDATIAFTCNIWENVAATTPYGGNAVNRRDRLK